MVDLRTLLIEAKQQGKVIIAPGVFDGNSALLLRGIYKELEGKDELDPSIYGLATFISGFLVSATNGQPDMALNNATDLEHRLNVIRPISQGVPIIVDIDTGFGSEAYTILSVGKRLHSAGANCVQIEDQAGDKTCGHMDGSLGTGKQVMDPYEFANVKVRPLADYALPGIKHLAYDFMVMARTDSRAIHGLDDALKRARLYMDAGAEILFVEAPQDDNELRRVGQLFGDDVSTHMLANMIEGSPKTPYHTVSELAQMGFSIVYYCIGSIFAATFGNGGMEAYYRAVLQGKDPVKEGILPSDAFARFNRLIGREIAERVNAYHRSLVNAPITSTS